MQRQTKFRIAAAATVGTVALGGGAVWAATSTDMFSDSSPTSVTEQEPDQDASEAAESDDATASDSPSPTASESPTDDTEDDSEHTPEEELALEATEVMTTWQPAQDTTQTDAEFRAAEMMTQERADEIVAPERFPASPEWREAANRDATSDPHAEIIPSGHGDGEIGVRVSWRWVADGHRPLTDDTVRTFFFTFTEGDDGEPLIADYTWQTLER